VQGLELTPGDDPPNDTAPNAEATSLRSDQPQPTPCTSLGNTLHENWCQTSPECLCNLGWELAPHLGSLGVNRVIYLSLFVMEGAQLELL